MTKVYRFEVEGFSDVVETLDQLKARILVLKRRFPWIIGMQCRIYVGTGTVKCATYVGGPAAVKIIEA